MNSILPKGVLLTESGATQQATSSSCISCSMHDLCLVEGLSAIEIEQLSGMVKTRRRVRRGAYLYKAGDPFDAIYPIRAVKYRYQ